jgi:hypothetical protein
MAGPKLGRVGSKALLKQGMAGGASGVFHKDFEGRAFLANGLLGHDRAMDLVVLFEEAVFALEGAFGGGFIAQIQIVLFDLVGSPVEGRDALEDVEIDIIVALSAGAVPFGLGGFEDEIIFERVFTRLVGLEPVVKEDEPGIFGFAGEDEGVGAGTVFDGVFGRDGAAFGRCGPGVAGVAFFGFVKHMNLS